MDLYDKVKINLDVQDERLEEFKGKTLIIVDIIEEETAENDAVYQLETEEGEIVPLGVSEINLEDLF